MDCGLGAIREYEIPYKPLQHYVWRDNINKDRVQYELDFDRTEMNKFNNEKFVTVFAKLDVILVEGKEDEFNMGLNNKFTSIPFFYIKIKNEFYSNFSWTKIIIVLLGSLLLLGLFYYWKNRQQIDDIQFESSYQKKDI